MTIDIQRNDVDKIKAIPLINLNYSVGAYLRPAFSKSFGYLQLINMILPINVHRRIPVLDLYE